MESVSLWYRVHVTFLLSDTPTRPLKPKTGVEESRRGPVSELGAHGVKGTRVLVFVKDSVFWLPSKCGGSCRGSCVGEDEAFSLEGGVKGGDGNKFGWSLRWSISVREVKTFGFVEI